MINEIFKAVMVMSFIGSTVSLGLFAIRPVLKKILSPRHSCFMWYIPLIAFLFPLSINIVSETPVEISSSKIAVANVQTEYEKILPSTQQETDVKDVGGYKSASDSSIPMSDSWIKVLARIWLAGFIVLILVRVLSYIIFSMKIRRKSEFLTLYNGVKVYLSSELKIPIAFGLIKKVIIIPMTIESEEETEYALMHEYRHLCHGDIFCKWIAMLNVCVHWFNPLSYLVSRIIDEECEYSCDASVAENLSESGKKEYMNTILSLMARGGISHVPLSTSMAGGKKNIIKRFALISEFQSPKRCKKIVSSFFFVMLVHIIICGCAVGGGKLHSEKIPMLSLNFSNVHTKLPSPYSGIIRKETDVYSQNSNEHNAQSMTDISVEPENIMAQEAETAYDEFTTTSHIHQSDSDNETVNVAEDILSYGDSVDVDDTERYPGDMRGILYFDNWSYEKTIDDLERCGYTQTSSDEKNLETSYVTGTLSYETGNVARITNVKSDENGNIEFYMDSEYDQYVEIGFEYEGKQISGSGFAQSQENIYCFGGFDPDKSYDIIIESSSGDTWKTTSKYVVY